MFRRKETEETFRIAEQKPEYSNDRKFLKSELLAGNDVAAVTKSSENSKGRSICVKEYLDNGATRGTKHNNGNISTNICRISMILLSKGPSVDAPDDSFIRFLVRYVIFQTSTKT